MQLPGASSSSFPAFTGMEFIRGTAYVRRSYGTLWKNEPHDPGNNGKSDCIHGKGTNENGGKRPCKNSIALRPIRFPSTVKDPTVLPSHIGLEPSLDNVHWKAKQPGNHTRGTACHHHSYGSYLSNWKNWSIQNQILVIRINDSNMHNSGRKPLTKSTKSQSFIHFT
jgi:hypothetical protein